MVDKAFKSMGTKPLSDKEVREIFVDHAKYLRGLSNYANMMLRERRWKLVWGVVVTGTLIWQVLR